MFFLWVIVHTDLYVSKTPATNATPLTNSVNQFISQRCGVLQHLVCRTKECRLERVPMVRQVRYLLVGGPKDGHTYELSMDQEQQYRMQRGNYKAEKRNYPPNIDNPNELRPKLYWHPLDPASP